MRFKRTPSFAFTDTPRKRAALRRKQQREWDGLPLFSDQTAEEQRTEDEVKARRMIDSLPAEEGRAVRRVWDRAPYPANPSRRLSRPQTKTSVSLW